MTLVEGSNSLDHLNRLGASSGRPVHLKKRKKDRKRILFLVFSFMCCWSNWKY